MVIAPFGMVIKLLLIQGVIAVKDLYSAWARWVHRHAGSIAIVLPILIIALIFLYGHWRGVQVAHDNENESHGATFRYDKVADITIMPWAGVMYEPAGIRGALGVELGYLRPIHIDLIGSIPLFDEVDINRIALGVGVSTPIRQNFFIGTGWNKEFFSENQREFWSIYGKIRF